MAEFLPNITVDGNDFVSLNALSSIAIGTAFWIQNKGFYPLHLIESATKPASTSVEGLIVGNIHSNNNNPNFAAGSLEIWVRCEHPPHTTKLHIEVS